MNHRIMFRAIGGLLALLFLFGCKPSTPRFALTINEKECTYEGPTTMQEGDFTIDLIINEQNLTETGYSLFTLEAGKTIEDVRAWKSVDQPPWVITIANVHEMAGGTHTYSYNTAKFTQNARYTGGPYYLVCFRTDPDTRITAALGVFGPIEVK
jgi:hypothetical protein